MRYVKYFVAMSLDAYIARPDGGVEWLFTERDYGMREFFSQIDTTLHYSVGRVSKRANEPPATH
jgi:dihydrofolate reductase